MNEITQDSRFDFNRLTKTGNWTNTPFDNAECEPGLQVQTTCFLKGIDGNESQ